MNFCWNSFIQSSRVTKYLTKKFFEQNSHCQTIMFLVMKTKYWTYIIVYTKKRIMTLLPNKTICKILCKIHYLLQNCDWNENSNMTKLGYSVTFGWGIQRHSGSLNFDFGISFCSNKQFKSPFGFGLVPSLSVTSKLREKLAAAFLNTCVIFFVNNAKKGAAWESFPAGCSLCELNLKMHF